MVKPFLCGGTAFCLIMQALKPRSKTRNREHSGTDKLDAASVLSALISALTGNQDHMNTSTFKKIASEYKNCEDVRSVYLPINAPDFSAKFIFMFEHNYNELLERIRHFGELYLALENNDKITWLIRAYLELLKDDSSIEDDAEIFIYPNGLPCLKKDLHLESDFYIFPFLLGIWRFIIEHRQDKNHKGRETFENWHTQSGQRTQWKFCSTIGCSTFSDIHVHLDNDIVDNNNNICDSIFANHFNEKHQERESYRNSTEHNETTHTTNVLQIGENNIHIDIVQNLNL